MTDAETEQYRQIILDTATFLEERLLERIQTIESRIPGHPTLAMLAEMGNALGIFSEPIKDSILALQVPYDNALRRVPPLPSQEDAEDFTAAVTDLMEQLAD